MMMMMMMIFCKIYRGYVDDPRNTDNAWMETVVMHFHDESGEKVIFSQFPTSPAQSGNIIITIIISLSGSLVPGCRESLARSLRRTGSHDQRKLQLKRDGATRHIVTDPASSSLYLRHLLNDHVRIAQCRNVTYQNQISLK